MSPEKPKAVADVLKDLMFGRGPVKRFTQDSPVMPDVWLEYGKRPGARVDLLLTPFKTVSAGQLCRAVRERWESLYGSSSDPDLAYNQSTVGACLAFRELLQVVLPLSSWWQKVLCEESEGDLRKLFAKKTRDRIAAALENPEKGARDLSDLKLEPATLRHLPDLLWMFRIVGALALGQEETGMEAVLELPEPAAGPERRGDSLPYYRKLVDAVAELMNGVSFRNCEPVLYSVNCNRPASHTISRSTLAVKADAARLLFHVSCREVSWAVIDSGVDATHPAFQAREPGTPSVPAEPEARLVSTRVLATYDFTRIRELLNPSKLTRDKLPEALRKRLEKKDPEAERFVSEELEELKRHLQRGRDIDWSLLEPLLRVPHEPGIYEVPESEHGTHVAGILAADWQTGDPGRDQEEPLVGLCPDLRLYDCRVLNDEGEGDEFAVIAALQFVRHLNAHKDYLLVHGANLSLSIRHDPSNYACGCTPVCEESERLVDSGVVVVAAAGNLGWRKVESLDSGPGEIYSNISITDPGNAEGVITVGATHRFQPHTYGVSYFSSRGPTGDGRFKPDLVAPGEKIEAPVPGEASRPKDGTSMAAPHVSGAAALLMARHRELAGKPRQIKRILCETATDLGRERYFQGSGMVDVLRALQSV